MAGRDANAGPSAGDGLSKLSRQAHASSMNSIDRTPLSLWYLANDGPWTGVESLNIPDQPMPSSGSNFGPYRSTHVPSETSTIPPSILTDSGYASGTRQSVGNPSVFGDFDHATDTQSLVGRMNEVGFYQPSSSVFATPTFSADHGQQGHHVGNWGQPGDHVISVNANTCTTEISLICKVCNFPCKNRSDLNKHLARHSKPHLCQWPGCTWPRGFSTANDLARHVRCKHRSAHGQGHFYKCNLAACVKGTKLWPRADNFRQHLTRKHNMTPPIESIDCFIYNGPDQVLEPSDNGSLELHTPSVGVDPAAIQSLASRVLEPIADLVGRGSHPADTCMADDVRGDLPQEVHILPDLSLPVDEAGQDDLPLAQDEQCMHVSPLEVHMDRHVFQQMPAASEKRDILEPRPRHGSGASSTTGRHMSTGKYVGPINREKPIIHNLEPSHRGDTDDSNISLASAFETEGEPEKSAALDEDRPSAIIPLGDHDTPDALDGIDTPESDTDTHSTFRVVGKMSGDDSQQTSPPSQRAIQTPTLAKNRASPEQDEGTSREERLVSLIKSLERNGEADKVKKVLEELGYKKYKSTSVKTKKQVSNQGASDGAQVACKVPGCGSTFQRECELRKHMKRHQKPYGCTDRKCTKRFGSKSDWKRHENSQHHSMDVWRCDEYANDPLVRGDESPLCKKACHRRETFKAHLSKDHGIGLSANDEDLVAKKLENCRFGKNCAAGFWCGFCVRVVETTGKQGLGGWTERYDHIDAHLCGRETPKRVFEDWKHDDFSSDPAPSRLCITPQSAAASASGFSSSDERTGNKRHPADRAGEHSGSSKRSRLNNQQKTGIWYCCNCKMWNSAVLTEQYIDMGCSDCRHYRCYECTIDDYVDKES